MVEKELFSAINARISKISFKEKLPEYLSVYAGFLEDETEEKKVILGLVEDLSLLLSKENDQNINRKVLSSEQREKKGCETKNDKSSDDSMLLEIAGDFSNLRSRDRKEFYRENIRKSKENKKKKEENSNTDSKNIISDSSFLKDKQKSSSEIFKFGKVENQNGTSDYIILSEGTLDVEDVEQSRELLDIIESKEYLDFDSFVGYFETHLKKNDLTPPQNNTLPPYFFHTPKQRKRFFEAMTRRYLFLMQRKPNRARRIKKDRRKVSFQLSETETRQFSKDQKVT